MSLKENFSTQLKAIRTFQNKSVAEFSADIGIAKSSLQDFEAGKGNPTLDTISIIAQNLDVEEAALLLPNNNLSEHSIDSIRLLLLSVPVLRELSSEKRLRAMELLAQLIDLYKTEDHCGA